MKPKYIYYAIGIIQITGGISGLLLLAYLLIHTLDINGTILLIYFIGFFLFIFSLNAGICILVNPYSKRSIVLSLINQFLQIFQWHIGAYGLSYSSGGELVTGIKEATLYFQISIIRSTFTAEIGSTNYFFLGINVFSLAIIFLIFFYKRKIIVSQ
jgi:hypothetical protein